MVASRARCNPRQTNMLTWEFFGRTVAFVATCIVFWWMYASLLPRQIRWIAVVLSLGLNGANLLNWYFSGDCDAARQISHRLMLGALLIGAIIRIFNPVKPARPFQSRYRKSG